MTGGMLSGVLEDDDGWFVAQLTTNQNETIGGNLRNSTLSRSCCQHAQVKRVTSTSHRCCRNCKNFEALSDFDMVPSGTKSYQTFAACLSFWLTCTIDFPSAKAVSALEVRILVMILGVFVPICIRKPHDDRMGQQHRSSVKTMTQNSLIDWHSSDPWYCWLGVSIQQMKGWHSQTRAFTSQYSQCFQISLDPDVGVPDVSETARSLNASEKKSLWDGPISRPPSPGCGKRIFAGSYHMINKLGKSYWQNSKHKYPHET